jgi:ABC-type polysaccharide/polyol phosphate export permease
LWEFTAQLKPFALYESKAGRSHLSDALRDLKEGLQRHAIWRELVRRDIYSKTKGAALGRWWIIIAQAVAISGMGLVYARLFGFSMTSYLPYLAAGLVTWSYILGLINEASDVFVTSKGYLTQVRFPLSVCLFRFVARNVIVFTYKTSIIFVVLLILQVPIGWSALIALVGVLLIAVAGFFTGVTLGLLHTRFRDVGQLVSSVTVLMFFLTPIIWRADRRLGEFSWIVEYNPLYHFLSLVRSPLIGESLTYWSFVMTGGTIALLVVVASITYKLLGREVIYWL